MKIAIIGAGLIGCERIEAIQSISKSTNTKLDIVAVYDINPDTLFKIKGKYNVPIVNDINLAMDLNPDWVFIATPNDQTYSVAKLAFDTGANILTEKPLGRSLEECEKIIALKPPHLKLFTGFNYRFFNSVEAALHDAKLGKFGKLISVNLILAHGNAPGMEKSWHLDPKRRGSLGADLGVHLFDLILSLSSNNNLKIDYAKMWRGHWNTGIEEEAHLLASDQNNTIFNIQISYNRWRSNFKLEINGTEGYGVVEGRGRSYGPQSYKTGKKWGWQVGKSQKETEIIIIDNDDCSNSFVKETAAILGFDGAMNSNCISKPCNDKDAYKIMKILDQYEKSLKW